MPINGDFAKPRDLDSRGYRDERQRDALNRHLEVTWLPHWEVKVSMSIIRVIVMTDEPPFMPFMQLSILLREPRYESASLLMIYVRPDEEVRCHRTSRNHVANSFVYLTRAKLESRWWFGPPLSDVLHKSQFSDCFEQMWFLSFVNLLGFCRLGRCRARNLWALDWREKKRQTFFFLYFGRNAAALMQGRSWSWHTVSLASGAIENATSFLSVESALGAYCVQVDLEIFLLQWDRRFLHTCLIRLRLIVRRLFSVVPPDPCGSIAAKDSQPRRFSTCWDTI